MSAQEDLEFTIRHAFDTFGQNLADEIKRFEEVTVEQDSFYGPSSEPLEWLDMKTKLLRLDSAIMAVHLGTARIMFNAYPALALFALRKFRGWVENFAAGLAARKLATRLFGAKYLITFAQLIANAFQDSKIQAEVERNIRDSSLIAMRQLHLFGMSQRRKENRHTKLVHTRHYTPPQRQPNKSWRSPRSKH